MQTDTYDLADLPAQMEPAARTMVRAYVNGEPGVLLVGHPGLGKTMLGRRMAGVVDRTLNDQQRRWIAIEQTPMVERVIGDDMGTAPFRAPHHSVSEFGLAGGMRAVHAVQCMSVATPVCVCGLTKPRHDGARGFRVSGAGECDSARFGVLQLSEIEEFRIAALQSCAGRLRRMGGTAPFVVADANPCGCGWKGTPRECFCGDALIERYNVRSSRMASILGIRTIIELDPFDPRERRDPSGPRCASSADILADARAEARLQPAARLPRHEGRLREVAR
jgi:predicted ATPase with chaperone activity